MKRFYIHTISLFNAIIFFMFIPFLSNFLIERISISFVSIVMPFSGIINVFTSFTLGNLSDLISKYKTYKIIQPMRIILWVLLVICLVIKNFHLLAIIYVFDSFFSVIISSTLSSYLYEIANNEENIKKYNTTNYIMFNIGVFIGPLIGGLYFEKFYFYIFVINLISLIVQYICFFRFFSKVEDFVYKKISIKNNLINTKKLLTNSFNIKYYLLLILIGIIWLGVYDSIMPTFFIQKHQQITFDLFNFKVDLKTYKLVSLALFINGILLIVITKIINKIVAKFDMWKKYLIIICIIVMGNLTFFFPNPGLVLVSIVFLSFGEVIMPVAQTQIIYRISNNTNRAQYISFFNSGSMIAISISSFFNYIVINWNFVSVPILLLFFGILAFICLIITKNQFRKEYE